MWTTETGQDPDGRVGHLVVDTDTSYRAAQTLTYEAVERLPVPSATGCDIMPGVSFPSSLYRYLQGLDPDDSDIGDGLRITARPERPDIVLDPVPDDALPAYREWSDLTPRGWVRRVFPRWVWGEWVDDGGVDDYYNPPFYLWRHMAMWCPRGLAMLPSEPWEFFAEQGQAILDLGLVEKQRLIDETDRQPWSAELAGRRFAEAALFPPTETGNPVWDGRNHDALIDPITLDTGNRYERLTDLVAEALRAGNTATVERHVGPLVPWEQELIMEDARERAEPASSDTILGVGD